MKRLLLFSCIIVLLVSCTTTKTVRKLAYELDCTNCGKSQDSYVSIEINKISFDDDYMILDISNLKDDILLLNEKMFCLAYNDTVEMNVIGFNNPYQTVSLSRAESVNKSKSYLVDDIYSRYYSGQIGTQAITSNSRTINYPEFLTLPPKSTYKYYFRSVLHDKYDKIIRSCYYKMKNDDRTYIDWEKAKKLTGDLTKDRFTVSIAYKVVSENNWKSATVSVKPKSVNLDEKIVQEKN